MFFHLFDLLLLLLVHLQDLSTVGLVLLELQLHGLHLLLELGHVRRWGGRRGWWWHQASLQFLQVVL